MKPCRARVVMPEPPGAFSKIHAAAPHNARPTGTMRRSAAPRATESATQRHSPRLEYDARHERPNIHPAIR